MRQVPALLALALTAGGSQLAIAQSQPVQLAASSAQAKQPTGLIVYPAGGQTPEQQARDEQACHAWAQQQAGPSAPAPSADSAAKAGKAKADSATRGAFKRAMVACLEGRGYTVQ